MVQGEGPQGHPGGAGVGAPEAPPRAARSAALPAGLGRRLAGGGGKRGAAPTGGTPVAADGSPLTPPGGRRGCAPGPCGRQGRKRPPAEPGAGGSFAVLADELPDEGALRDELGTDGEEVAVAFQQAFHRFTVFPGVLYLLQQAGDDSAV